MIAYKVEVRMGSGRLMGTIECEHFNPLDAARVALYWVCGPKAHVDAHTELQRDDGSTTFAGDRFTPSGRRAQSTCVVRPAPVQS